MKNILNKCFEPHGLSYLSMIGIAAVAFSERDVASLPFLLSVFCAILMTMLILSKRVRFSLVTTWALFAVITVISAMKMHYMGTGLHVLDIFFYHENSEMYRFLIGSYLPVVLLSLATFAVGVVISVLIYRRSVAINTPRILLAGLFFAAVVAAGATYPRPGDDQSYHVIGHRTSSFFVSLKDMRFLVFKPAFVERLTSYSSDPGYQGLGECSQTKPRPDIVAVLMELAVPPSFYPAIKVGAELNNRFRSVDGVIRPLRVETIGGGTSITSAALMTSLPGAEFGWLAPYLPVYLQGRVHHSLPKLLRQCGYKTAVISPLPHPFMNEGAFMTSLGFEDYRDVKSIGAPTTHERDTFYFHAALDYIRHHRAQDGRPLFLFLMTMAAHGPYSYRFEPDSITPGEPFGNTAKIDEYLRRLTMQQTDFEAFNYDLAMLKGGHGLMLLDFGDHQPSVTVPLAEAMEGKDALARLDLVAYRTYYRIRAVNMPLAVAIPRYRSMDIAYLAPTLIQTAGLPIDDVYAELLALRESCKGSFIQCFDRARIERHLKRLVKGHLLDLRWSGSSAL